MSPCRSDFIFGPRTRSAWRQVSEDSPSNRRTRPFLLIACTPTLSPPIRAGSRRCSGIPAYGQVLLRLAICHLRTVRVVTRLRQRAQSFLLRSARCRAVRTVSSHLWVWRTVSEDSRSTEGSDLVIRVFPADCPSTAVCHCRSLERRVPGFIRRFQHTARFINVTTTVNFIVTAAVYRGFSSELCLAANPSL